MKRPLAVALMGVIAPLGFVLDQSATVLAAACSPGHCYAVAEWDNTPTNEGSYVYLDTSCLNGPNNSTDFADEELWEGTDNSTFGAFWVEEGLSYGEINGSPKGGPFWFWADNRPNGGGYHEHYVASRSLNTSYLADIGYQGNNQWFVYSNVGGTVGTSTSNPPYSKFTETGEEFTNTSYNIYGYSSDLSWYDTSGGNHNGWDYGGNNSYVWNTGSPAYSWWSTTYVVEGYNANPGNCHAAPTAGPAAAPPKPSSVPILRSATPHYSQSPVPPKAMAGIMRLAHDIAARSGSTEMQSGAVVLTTRGQANFVTSGASVNTDDPVYLIELTGQFEALAARVPANHTKPTGHYLTFTVNTATGSIEDWGVSDNWSDLSTLGPQTAVS